MKWDNVNITDKIHYLKELIMNEKDYQKEDVYIIDALITGSQNTFSGDIGFEIKSHHIEYMSNLWNDSIDNQKDDSVINKIKKKINKF